jgi:hypothetical protein
MMANFTPFAAKWFKQFPRYSASFLAAMIATISTRIVPDEVSAYLAR